jgi:hypothetical protein
MLLWSLASSEHELSPKLAQAITSQAVECGHEFTPQGISNVIWAFATLKVEPPAPLLRSLLQRSVLLRRSFDAQATANLLWALAALGEHTLPHELTQALLESATARASNFAPQGVANTLWALVCLLPPPPPQRDPPSPPAASLALSLSHTHTHADALHRALDALSLHVLKHLSLYHDMDLRQLHQFFLETRLGVAGSWRMSLKIYIARLSIYIRLGSQTAPRVFLRD